MRQWACLCVFACVAACQPRGADVGAPATATARATVPASGLQVSLDHALRTERLQPSRFEDKEAAPGDTFIVLDVRVRNPGRETRVFNAGPLLIVAGGKEHRFDTPENILADGYLLLEALKPAASVRGRIVYEVPADLSGAIYWLPGNGQRLPVRTDAGRLADSAPHGTVAAAPADSGASAPVAASTHARVAPKQLRQLACRALVDNNDRADQARYQDFFRQQCAGYRTPPAWTLRRADTVAATAEPTPTARAPVAQKPRAVAPVKHVAAVAPPRNPSPEPAPQVVRGDSGPSFDCAQAVVRAEHLVCEDALLSLLDRELAQAVSDAERKVPDPTALLHDQDDWRARVRDACQTLACLEHVYTQRTAGLRAIGGFAEVK
ncbi:MAG TPA: DUF4352 domain-containing protein [Luteimonas sp.]|jgi:hypothetical protein|nr:DUF4352 domain-containing protein [Luteimonas sp.]